MSSLLANPYSVLSKQLYYKSSTTPDRTRPPVSPRMNIRLGSLKKALLIGLDMRYSSYDLNNLPTREIQLVENLIRRIAPRCVITTICEKPYDLFDQSTTNGITVAGIRAAMDWLGTGIGRGENVLFYYIGHGTRRDDTQKWPDNDPQSVACPENPNVNDEPLMNVGIIGNPMTRRPDFCIPVPELMWNEPGIYDPVNDITSDRGFWSLKIDKTGNGGDRYILIRDDEIRSRIVDRLPAGSKGLIYLGACNSGGGGDLKYELDLMTRNSTGIVPVNYMNINLVNEHLVGMNYSTYNSRYQNLYTDTAADVVVIAATQYDENTGVTLDENVSDFGQTFLNALQEQINDNISRFRSSNTLINLKKLYYNFRNDMANTIHNKSAPQISIGRNLGLLQSYVDGTSFMAPTNGAFNLGNYIVVINNDGSVQVNNETIGTGNKYINGTLVKIIPNYHNSVHINNTLVIGDYDFDIIPPSAAGQPFLLDIPIMFDIAN